MKAYKSAFYYADKGYKSAVETNAFMEISESSNILCSIYVKENNYQKDYEFLSIYNNYKDSISNENKLRQIGRLETKYEFEKEKNN